MGLRPRQAPASDRLGLPVALEPRWPAALDVALGPLTRFQPRRPLQGHFPDHLLKSLPLSRRWVRTRSVVTSLLQVPGRWADRGPWGQRPCTQPSAGSAHVRSIRERVDEWGAGSPSVQDTSNPRCTWSPALLLQLPLPDVWVCPPLHPANNSCPRRPPRHSRCPRPPPRGGHWGPRGWG